MKIASVVMSNAIREYDKEYHYIIPADLEDKMQPGIRVIAPFGKANKATEAYVLDILDGVQQDGLKEIKKVIDAQPVLNPDMIRLAGWMKDRYISTYSDVMKCMLPPGIGVKSLRIVKLLRQSSILKSTAKKIMDVLIEQGDECEYEELKRLVDSRAFSTQLKSLEEAGIVSIYEEFSASVREKTVRVAYIARPREEIIDEIENNRVNRIQHVRVLEMLMDNQYISVSDIMRFAAVSSSVINTLKKYGYIEFTDIEINRDPMKNKVYKRTKPLEPTPQQAEALEKINAAIQAERFEEFLIHGVTGSGKTEVYLQLIRNCIDKGKQAVVLVPEISLTPQMIERFKGRFGDEVAVLHSRLSLGERYDQWRLIRDGKIKVAVGARSAVFAPFDRLGVVIMDEEHENTYKSEVTPKYHARDVARERCRYNNAVLVLGSATPSTETYYRAESKQINLLEMTQRANNLVLPKVDVVDMREELQDGNRTIFSRRLAEEIIRNKQNQQQTILFLNKRGYASFVLCRQCGFTARCLHCNISLTYHAYDERLICHYCGYTVKSPKTCPKCQSSYIRHFGTGTQKVEEEIEERFKGFSCVRMDMDTTTGKNSHEEILKAFRERNIDIMVGTQMIAKGHDFPNVTLVGVLAADSLLNLEDFRASERTFQLITQVAGRAGRGEIPGRVVIQTYNTEDFSIIAACSHDYSSFYRQEIKLREKLDYPPFTNIATVILNGTNDRAVFLKAKEIKESLDAAFEGKDVEAGVYGPARAPLSRIKNKFRWRIVVKCRCEDTLNGVMRDASDEFYRKKGKSLIDMSVDVNPLNML
ncbi:MAG: primosomal protein N' [Clostridia bacterium]|nr:primosomal protein N' [Clostridia bacterium]